MIPEPENPYRNYPHRPVLLGDVKELERSGRLAYVKDSRDVTVDGVITIPVERQFPKVRHTIDGLTDDLAPGSALCDRFVEEVLPQYEEATVMDPLRPPYGTLVYYPNFGHLVWYAPKEWHRVALLTRNSLLIRDAQQRISWEEQRELFQSTIVGSAGASVGKNAFLRVLDTLNPDAAKIADPREYKDTNSRRTQLGYWEIGASKAATAALQAHSTDPYTAISVYDEGLHAKNSQDFMLGDKTIGEPGIDYLIEETDDPDAKINLRALARQYKIPVLMVTDVGVAHQIDVRHFRKFPNLSLAVGVNDDELLSAQAAWHNDRANRELFFNFAFKLIGQDWRNVPEFRDIVLKNLETPFAGGIPQLGVAAHAGGADIALMIALDRLGYELPERDFVNPRERWRMKVSP